MPSRKIKQFLLSLNSLHRVSISLILSLIVFFLLRNSHFGPMMVGMMLWDVFAFSFVLTSWLVFFKSSTNHIKKRAQSEDGSRGFVFFIVILSSIACLVTVLLLIVSLKKADVDKAIFLPVIIGGMMLSWIMVHTTFCFHYARLFYNPTTAAENTVQELNFPEEPCPDYLDFAYFSFVIGMTFQVSDVTINSRLMRRLALAHALLSFAINTFVVALTINLIAGLKA
jgi:uncharacterized membrane protein